MIQRSRTHLLSAILLLIALTLSTTARISAQEQERDRRVESTALVATLKGAPKTIEELRARIREVLSRSELAPAQAAVKVASLETGRVLFEENEGKLLHPASVMKIYTVAAALDQLTPDFRFKTSVYALNRPDSAGIIRGDLIIYGRGDPSIAARFHNGNYYEAIDQLAARIAAAGIKRVEGDLVGDESYFTGAPFGFGWEWGDLQWHDGAAVSALSINDNGLDLFVKPGGSVGAPCAVTTGPPTPLVTFTNRTTTTPRGTKRELTIHRGVGEKSVVIGGSLPVGDPGWTGNIAVPDPALVFVYMLRGSLAALGVTVTGSSRTVAAPSPGAGVHAPPASLIELTSQQSPPLSEIAALTLKPSQNMYAELILRALGNTQRTDAKLDSDVAGIEAVKAFLRKAGVDSTILIFRDGSGLSNRDLVTADATLKLLVYMDRHPYAKAFREALPLAGVEGTLRSRLKGTVASNNVRAKTGTLPTIAALSGYATTAAGERLAFAILVNNCPEGSPAIRGYIDEITVLLASYAGKS